MTAVLPASAAAMPLGGSLAAGAGTGAGSGGACSWSGSLEMDTRPALQLSHMTTLRLNETAPSADGLKGDDARASEASAAAPRVARCEGLELSLAECHDGELIGSIVWDGGKVLSWFMEGLHDRVRRFDPGVQRDGGAFVEPQELQLEGIGSRVADTFSSSATLEQMTAAAAGHSFELARNFLVGARVLELGAGTGVAGLACVKLGAREVVLTDIAALLPLMKENAKRNAPGCLREQWRDSKQEMEKSRVNSQPASFAPASMFPLANGAPSTDLAAAASIPSSFSAPAASTPLHSPCSNCDDLCACLLRCDVCSESLCAACDQAFHRPASKRTHCRKAHTADQASALSPCPSPAAAPAAPSTTCPFDPPCPPPCPPLPPFCDVYAEELLWGAHSSLSGLSASLRAPFDVLLLADVVYDAYSTSGVGASNCDNYRRLFQTLCLLSDHRPHATILLTYTPRRASEHHFFRLLSTQFLWSAHRATDLLPHHSGIDRRIWIYHLHRSRVAERIRRRVYLHEEEDSEAWGERVQRLREQELDSRRARARQQRPKEACTEPTQRTNPVDLSFTSVAAADAVAVTSGSAPASPCAASASSSASPSCVPPLHSDCSLLRAPILPANLTPAFARHLEAEEERQERNMQERRSKRQNNKI